MGRRSLVLAIAGVLLVSGALAGSATASVRSERSDQSDRAQDDRQRAVPRRDAVHRQLPGPDRAAARVHLLRRLDDGRGAEPAADDLARPARPWVPSRAAGTGDRPEDAMPTGASWARTRSTARGKVFWPSWAPSLYRLGPSRFLAAYAVPNASDGRRCVSVATALERPRPVRRPLGRAAGLRHQGRDRPVLLPGEQRLAVDALQVGRAARLADGAPDAAQRHRRGGRTAGAGRCCRRG